MKRRIEIEISEATLQQLDLLSKILDRSRNEVAEVVLELLVPGLVSLVYRVLEVLKDRGVLTQSPEEVIKYLTTNMREQKREDSKIEKFLQTLQERGEMSIGEALSYIDPEELRKLILKGAVRKVGTRILPAQ